jgi:hypothetical protein
MIAIDASVGATDGPNKENVVGIMIYNRAWFHDDLYAVTCR